MLSIPHAAMCPGPRAFGRALARHHHQGPRGMQYKAKDGRQARPRPPAHVLVARTYTPISASPALLTTALPGLAAKSNT